MIRIPKLILNFLICSILILIPTYFLLKNSFDNKLDHELSWAKGSNSNHFDGVPLINIEGKVEGKLGKVIMGKLNNETIKAEVGRASWKLVHTMAARFPLKPTPSEREAFSSFLYLFSRMYPCGECATHFQELLLQYPPQTASRTTASIHLCHLHNKVNTRLSKPQFDCGKELEGLYDCGCGDEPVTVNGVKEEKKVKVGLVMDQGEVNDLDAGGGSTSRKVKGKQLVEKEREDKKEVIDEVLERKELELELEKEKLLELKEAKQVEEDEEGVRRDKVTGEKLMGG